jgi:hypothetical protein
MVLIFVILFQLLLINTTFCELQLSNGIHSSISSQALDTSDEIMWSILICTIENRDNFFKKLYEKLENQILESSLQNKVEILYFRDNRKFSIGFKRNQLLSACKGKYVNFIDDDDDVHANYVQMLYDKMQCNPDCISLVGIIYQYNGSRKFIHSIQYDKYFEQSDIYFRPPNHLNPIKREIAIRFIFPQVNNMEDTNWAMQIARSKLLKKEEPIYEPYYFYYVHRGG